MNIELRKLLDSDKKTYFELESETWVNKRMLQDEEANSRSWKAMFADTEAHYAVLMGNQVHVVSSFAPDAKPDTDSVCMIVIAVGNEYNIMDRKIQVLL